jgi:predicted nucleic acid-binding protein
MNHVLAATLLRVVLDTNIYIAAFGHPKGRDATLWAVALARRYRLLVSPAPQCRL